MGLCKEEVADVGVVKHVGPDPGSGVMRSGGKGLGRCLRLCYG